MLRCRPKILAARIRPDITTARAAEAEGPTRIKNTINNKIDTIEAIRRGTYKNSNKLRIKNASKLKLYPDTATKCVSPALRKLAAASLDNPLVPPKSMPLSKAPEPRLNKRFI